MSLIGSIPLWTGVTGTAPAHAATAPVHCGQVVTADITLTADLTCPTPYGATGLTIAASHVKVNLNGHTITGPAQDTFNTDTIGIAVAGPGVTDVTIRNGAVRDFEVNLLLSQASHVEITDITSALQVAAAIEGTGAQDVRLDGVRLQPGFYPTGGLVFLQGSSVTVERSTALESFHLCQSSSCRIEASDLGNLSCWNCISALTGNTAGVQLLMTGSDSVTLADNHFTSGVSIQREPPGPGWQHTALRVTHNTFAVPTGTGLAVTVERTGQLAGASISDNTFTGNGGDGLDLEAAALTPAAATIRVTDDTAAHNTRDGLHIGVPAGSGVRVADNRTSLNGAYGIWANPGTVIDGGDNTSTGNPNGCLGVVCTP